MKRYSFVLLVVAPTLLLAIFVYSGNRPKLHNDTAINAEAAAPLTQELASGSVAVNESSAEVSSIDATNDLSSLSSLSSLPSSSSLSSSNSFSSSISSAPYSYPRVEPRETIGKFLQDMDESALPKIDLPGLKRDEGFDYKNATPEQLKQKAVVGDAVAAFHYAETIKNRILSFRDAQNREKNYWNPEEGKAEIAEMRDFYMHALQGGVKQAAMALSSAYSRLPLIDRIEALAWRKISFAIGESKQWDCLRDSTSCTVKEFNDLNGTEFFAVCIANDYYQCSPAIHQAASVMALDYMHNYQFSSDKL